MKIGYSNYDHGKIEAKDQEMSANPGPRNAIRVFLQLHSFFTLYTARVYGI